MALIDFTNWLETLHESMATYVNTGLDAAVDAATGQNTTGFYDVRFAFPTDKEQKDMLPLKKTMIHFEIDSIEEQFIGIGSNITEEVYDSGTGTITQYEAQCHLVNLDVGIWTGDDAGGELACRRARQRLNLLFHGPTAKQAIKEAVGVQINSWSGGRFVREYIAEQVVYRVADMELILRIYSKHATPVSPVEDIGGFTQAPALDIDGIPLS